MGASIRDVTCSAIFIVKQFVFKTVQENFGDEVLFICSTSDVTPSVPPRQKAAR